MATSQQEQRTEHARLAAYIKKTFLAYCEGKASSVPSLRMIVQRTDSTLSHEGIRLIMIEALGDKYPLWQAAPREFELTQDQKKLICRFAVINARHFWAGKCDRIMSDREIADAFDIGLREYGRTIKTDCEDQDTLKQRKSMLKLQKNGHLLSARHVVCRAKREMADYDRGAIFHLTTGTEFAKALDEQNINVSRWLSMFLPKELAKRRHKIILSQNYDRRPRGSEFYSSFIATLEKYIGLYDAGTIDIVPTEVALAKEMDCSQRRISTYLKPHTDKTGWAESQRQIEAIKRRYCELLRLRTHNGTHPK